MSIRHIAELAGASAATVSMALRSSAVRAPAMDKELPAEVHRYVIVTHG